MPETNDFTASGPRLTSVETAAEATQMPVTRLTKKRFTAQC